MCESEKLEKARNILLLDSSEQSAQEIQRFLKASAHVFSLSHAPGVEEGLNYLKNRKPDVVLLDSEITGDKNFSALRQWLKSQNIPVILLSDTDREETARQVELSGAEEYLVKNKLNLFNLQKIIQNILKVSETETKLDNAVSRFSNRDESLFKLLNKINAGVLVLNENNSIAYANTKLYSILSNETVRHHLSGYLNYRELEEEETLVLKPGNQLSIELRISETEWNNEKANLFLIESEKLEGDSQKALLSGDVFQTLLNSTRGNVLLIQEGIILFANKAGIKTLGTKSSEIVSQPLEKFIVAEGLSLQNKSIHSLFADKESEGVLRLLSGATLRIKYLLKPVNLSGAFYELFSFETVSDQADLLAPKGRTDGSKFSNDSIMHLASHDLREPVRTILNYVQLLSDNLDNKKYEAASEYAGFAKEAAGRMDQLLSDLKIFISLNEHDFSLSKVSMKSVAADVLKRLKKKVEETEAEINVAALPEVHADIELVQMLLYYLTDNAIKFCKKGKKPVVDIGFDKFEGNVIFCVRDNGIGISKKYYQLIFESFERLNRVDEYTGNGLGLAICKKIVAMHGGEIWVESLPGAGSNFYFTLRGK
ncbi:MAG: response regulator [Bacteroidetes bacterium]|nr:response regulator [Bacteroidota bacterium]